MIILGNLSDEEKKILNLIRVNGLLSHRQISELTNLSLAKINNIIKKIDGNNLIQVIEGSSTGGRRPKIIKIKDDIFHILGFEVSYKHLRAVVTDTNGNIISSLYYDKPFKQKRYASLTDIFESGSEILRTINFTWKNITAIGIGITGMVDENNGSCIFFPNAKDWNNLKVVDILKEKTNVQNIFITDSVRAMALAESRYGACKEFSDFILLYIGEGLGAGIVINKNIIVGSRGISGEIGHTYVGGHNRMCVCGNYGCLETEAAGWAIVENAKIAIKNGVYTLLNNLVSEEYGITLQNIIEAAKKADKFAINLIDEVSKLLAIAISTLMNLLDPQVIIISGELVNGVDDILITPLINNTRTKTIPWLRKDINILKSKLGENIAPLGAATLALDKAFNNLF